MGRIIHISGVSSGICAAHSPHPTYTERHALAMRADVASAPGPEVVVKLVERVLATSNRRPRYAVGRSTTTVAIARRLFSDRLNLRRVQRHFGF